MSESVTCSDESLLDNEKPSNLESCQRMSLNRRITSSIVLPPCELVPSVSRSRQKLFQKASAAPSPTIMITRIVIAPAAPQAPTFTAVLAVSDIGLLLAACSASSGVSGRPG